MNLNKIIAIGGKSGLYSLVSQTKNGFIVEGLADKKKFPVYSSSQVSSLEEVSIYTYDEDKPLKEVLKNIFDYTQENELISPKASKDELLDFFEKVVPNYNKEEVYASDVKKIIQWYKSLQDSNLLDFSEEAEVENKEVEA